MSQVPYVDGKGIRECAKAPIGIILRPCRPVILITRSRDSHHGPRTCSQK